MTNETITPTDDAAEVEVTTLETEIADDDAQAEIAEAVSARHSIARKHVLRLRRRDPEASPAEIVQALERQYTAAITAAGTAIAVGGFAATVGISLIPLGGAAAAGAKAAGHKAASAAAKATFKKASKDLALGAAKTGAGRVAALLPADEQQLQFEITAIFGLALADIHRIEYDRDQAKALVYGLTNERVSQQQIAQMAADVASASPEATASAAGGAQWASTLAEALPGGAAQSLVRTMQTGQLDAMRDSMGGKQQAAVDYGVRAVTGGVTRFVFGRDVVKSARTAFPPAPEEFPAHLAVPLGDEEDDEPNRAIAALENAARTTGGRIVDAAGTATRVFRSVDLDGDGIPDEAQALTFVKGAGGAVAGAAGAVGGRVGGLFKRGKRSEDESAAEALEPDVLGQIAKLAALKDQGVLTEDEFAAKKAELLARL
ncbi:SHOCT domain-containing protein [Amnibacterium setariae]|uniref:SHOCT domain-containing protein n=1 Tax=Amnibacterium setariae TaxID=2306585 RepID=A0A3A1TWC2_9MICO|nr:SHOCT domain-containing protein [Amnibacterium setariae]RIX27851.1 SHOCT domain-containing protein [Amnibacterium setariae]